MSGRTFVYDGATRSVSRRPDLPLPPTDFVQIGAWRVMYTVPGQPRPQLYSPIYGSAVRGGIPSAFIASGSTRLAAVCPHRQPGTDEHRPPHPTCTCGIYAARSRLDGLYRLSCMVDNLRRNDWWYSWFPLLNPAEPCVKVPVLLRVNMFHASFGDEFAYWHPLASIGGHIKTRWPVLRAAESEIVEMFLPSHDVRQGPTPRDAVFRADDAAGLAAQLHSAFGVPATVGMPPVSPRDWREAPKWMTQEPWATRYRLRELLSAHCGITDVPAPATAEPEQRDPTPADWAAISVWRPQPVAATDNRQVTS